MRAKLSALPITIGALLLPSPAIADNASVTQLNPTSSWNAHWADDSCQLARAFGSKDAPVNMRLERFVPSDGFQVVLVGQQFSPLTKSRTFIIRYGVNGTVRTVESAIYGQTAEGTFVISFTSSLLPDSQPFDPNVKVTPDQEAAVQEISLEDKDGRRIVLKTGSLGRPFAELRRCADQLMQSWGLDPIRQSRLQRQPEPKGNVGPWVTDADYPPQARKEHIQGVTVYQLMVDAKGMPTQCKTPVTAFSNVLLNAKTCQMLMLRARFTPALDAEGKPAASYFIGRIRWALP